MGYLYDVDGRDLIFGHKLHIGTSYCGKRFWTRQIPTSYIRFLSSTVAEKNATKNVHICSMCIKINKVGKQEVGI
jgi:REP element-mobilizing transposase RayT